MSRHIIQLPASLPSGKAVVICGYDRCIEEPYERFFCDISASDSPTDMDEPIWTSYFDKGYKSVQDVDEFDAKLASYGITLPAGYKQALREDWESKDMRRIVWWPSNGNLSEGV